MVYIYKYFRLCYFYFEGDENAFFKSIGFIHMALFIFCLTILSICDLLNDNTYELPNLTKKERLIYALVFLTVSYYTSKFLLVKIFKVDPSNGTSSIYHYTPSTNGVRINFGIHILLLIVFFFLSYLRS